jgi:membrane-associated protein
LAKRFKQEKNAERARVLLSRHGPVILTTSLLANLTRFWVAFVAGTQKYPFLKFLFYSGAASLTWTSFMVITGFLAGIERKNIENAFVRVGVLAWFFIVLAIVVIYLKAKSEFNESKGEK